MERWKTEVYRRRDSFLNLVHRFTVKYSDALGFIAGWTAYPIGVALLSLLGLMK